MKDQSSLSVAGFQVASLVIGAYQEVAPLTVDVHAGTFLNVSPDGKDSLGLDRRAQAFMVRLIRDAVKEGNYHLSDQFSRQAVSEPHASTVGNVIAAVCDDLAVTP